MFTYLQELCKNFNIEISLFWENTNRVKGDLYEILKLIEKKFNWRNGRLGLLRRIRKIAKNSNFSVREKKLLRKLVNQQVREGYQDFKAILHFFPGKTIEMLQRKYNEKFSYLNRDKGSI